MIGGGRQTTHGVSNAIQGHMHCNAVSNAVQGRIVTPSREAFGRAVRVTRMHGGGT